MCTYFLGCQDCVIICTILSSLLLDVWACCEQVSDEMSVLMTTMELTVDDVEVRAAIQAQLQSVISAFIPGVCVHAW